MDAGVYRRGVAELGYRQGRGGAGAMRDMWVVAIVLWVMLLAFLAWCLTLPEVEDEPEHTAQVDVVKVMVKWE